MTQAKLKVKLIEHTPNIEKVIAMSGKLCYSPSTLDELEDKLTEENVDKFINMIMGIGHESILEHCSFTFAIEGVSRALTHQLVRHRIASYSQKSQRYVSEGQFQYIIPVEIEKIRYLKEKYIKDMEDIQAKYNYYVDGLLDQYIYDYLVEETKLYSPDIQQDPVLMRTIMKTRDKKMYSDFEKKAIENARYILPNACETKIIVTMNVRSLLHFFHERCCDRAQYEIQKLAYLMLLEAKKVSPLLFKKAGAKCVSLGYCPEGRMCCGRYPTKEIMLENAKKYIELSK